MSINYYLQKNKFKNSGSDYVPATVKTSELNLGDLIKRMAEKGTTIKRADIMGAMYLFMDVVQDALTEGIEINLDDFMKISAHVTGRFDTYVDKYNANKHSIKIKANFNKKFTKRIKTYADIKKVKEKQRHPVILNIKNGITGKNEIGRNYSTRIQGRNLKYYVNVLAGIKISCEADLSKYVLIPVESLVVQYHTPGNLIFSFKKDTVFPEWLENNTAIIAGLCYDAGENKLSLYSPGFKSIWIDE